MGTGDMHSQECDRCGSTTIESRFREKHPYNIVIENGDGCMEAHERWLCRECENELLEWVDGDEPDRGDQADLLVAHDTSDELRMLASELEEVANRLAEASK